MSRPSETEDDLTQVLVKAGEILRNLTPPTFTSLLLIADDEMDTQTEIAETIGRTRPTVSKYLNKLKDMPIALARNPGQHYTVTEEGEQIVTLIHDMIDRLRTDSHTIDWSDSEDREKVATFFAPLHNSRSTLPFFILYSIGSRSAVGDRIHYHDPPQPIQIWDVVDDIEVRQEKRGKSVTVKQIRQTLWRFDDAGSVEFDGEQIKLSKKGREQAFLLEQLIQMLKEQKETDVDEDANESTSSSYASTTDTTQSIFGDAQTSSSESSVTIPGSDNLAGQDDPRGFLDSGRASHDISRKSSHESPTIIPTYCLRPTDDQEITLTEGEKPSERLDSQSQPSPVLPITTLTLEELADQVDRLIDEYNGAIEIKPYWALQTGTRQYPLAPARFALDDAYRRAWNIVNNAYDLWNNQSEESSPTE
jgi:DNA-binding MarR family transcriptional regulator